MIATHLSEKLEEDDNVKHITNIEKLFVIASVTRMVEYSSHFMY